VRLTDAEIREAMDVLGLVPQDFLTVKQARTPEEAKEVLRVLKDKARRGFKKAALKLHPDHGGDQTLFVRVKSVVEHIESLQVRPRPVPRRVVMYRPAGIGIVFGTTNASTTASTTPWGTGNVYTVVI